MTKVFVSGSVTEEGGKEVFVYPNENMNLRDETVLDPKPSQEIMNHSPDGFNWGYSGSGPSQLALAMLLEVYGSKQVALKFYNRFTKEVIAHMPERWVLTDEAIRQWMVGVTRKSGSYGKGPINERREDLLAEVIAETVYGEEFTTDNCKQAKKILVKLRGCSDSQRTAQAVRALQS